MSPWECKLSNPFELVGKFCSHCISKIFLNDSLSWFLKFKSRSLKEKSKREAVNYYQHG